MSPSHHFMRTSLERMLRETSVDAARLEKNAERLAAVAEAQWRGPQLNRACNAANLMGDAAKKSDHAAAFLRDMLNAWPVQGKAVGKAAKARRKAGAKKYKRKEARRCANKCGREVSSDTGCYCVECARKYNMPT